MEGTLSPGEKQVMISSFLEIAVGQSADTATQFLQATGWKLDDAIQLFYVGNEGGIAAPGSPSMAMENSSAWTDENVGARNDFGNANFGQGGLEEVRAPLPVVRDTLYDDAVLYGPPRAGNLPHEPSAMVAFRNFDEEMKQPAVWESEKGATSGGDNPRDNLASLYRPPFHLMFNGSFDKAKSAASVEDKWLLVNLQSTKEFSSHMLNRDTWANEAVAQTISTNFIFWQVYDDTSEGRKVCTYYKLDSIPVVLVIDPITGQKMRSWIGMVQPENLLEDILSFMDGGPRDYHKNLSHKRPRGNSALPEKNIQPVDDTPATSENSKKDSTAVSSDNKSTTSAGEAEVEEAAPAKKVVYPPLPEEPKTDRSLLCRVGVRLPDGRRFQRNFLKTDPIQLLWSFCSSLLEEGGIRPFRLTQAIPGAKSLDFDSKLSFQESGLANSMVSVAWE